MPRLPVLPPLASGSPVGAGRTGIARYIGPAYTKVITGNGQRAPVAERQRCAPA